MQILAHKQQSSRFNGGCSSWKMTDDQNFHITLSLCKTGTTAGSETAFPRELHEFLPGPGTPVFWWRRPWVDTRERQWCLMDPSMEEKTSSKTLGVWGLSWSGGCLSKAFLSSVLGRTFMDQSIFPYKEGRNTHYWVTLFARHLYRFTSHSPVWLL